MNMTQKQRAIMIFDRLEACMSNQQLDSTQIDNPKKERKIRNQNARTTIQRGYAPKSLSPPPAQVWDSSYQNDDN